MAKELGVRASPLRETFGRLRLTDDALNGPYGSGELYACGWGFGKAYGFEIASGIGRTLSRYARRDGTACADEAVAVEVPGGGRLVVLGWGLAHADMPSARRHQILAAAGWAARGALPVVLETPSQVVVVPRCDSTGRLVSVLLLNVSLDTTPELTLSSRDFAVGGWTWMRPGRRVVSLPPGGVVTVPPLEAWGVGVLLPVRRWRSLRTGAGATG